MRSQGTPRNVDGEDVARAATPRGRGASEKPPTKGLLSARGRVIEAQAALARGDRAAALKVLKSGRILTSDDPAAIGDWGVSLVQCGDIDAALPFFEAAAAQAPGERRAAEQLLLGWKTAAERAFEEGRFGDAARAFGRCAFLAPADPTFPGNQGLCLWRLGRLDEALAVNDEALRRDTAYIPAWSNRGLIQVARGDLTAAGEALARALELAPRERRAHLLLHRAFVEERRGLLETAAATLEEALRLDPELAEGWNNLGNLRREQGELAASMVALDRALSLRPGWPLAVSSRLLAAASVVEDAEELGRLHRRLVSQTLALVTETEAASSSPGPRGVPSTSGPPVRDPRPDRRLTVAYLSPDFREHPVGRLMAPVLAARVRAASRVLVYADVAVPDVVTGQVEAAVDAFVNVTGLSRQTLAERCRQDGVDVLVDLAGHTAGGRWAEMAPRLAPVQVFYLGYPGDTGLPTLDARLSDAVADPPAALDPRGTPVVTLEGGFLAFSPELGGGVGEAPARSEGGTLTFGSFNNAAKVSDATLDLWSEVLRAMPQARLLLKARALGDAGTRTRLGERFAARGVDPARVELRGHTAGAAEHLGAYREVDVALDPTPYGGTTTTCEALWMGVPVVTLRGRTHAARVGASLLHHVGRPAWIAESRADYVAIACALMNDESARRRWRREARAIIGASPLGDPARLARELENAYRRLWKARVGRVEIKR